jgi:hypothetical protein
LPCIYAHPFCPKHATLVIAKDDPDIGPVSFRVYHVKTCVFYPAYILILLTGRITKLGQVVY